MEVNKIIQGEALEVLKTLPDCSIDMVMTSPPYWGLRDYQIEKQLGLETDFNDYVQRLVDIFREVKRVLKDAGTIYVNLGDTYMPHNGTRGNKTTAGADTLRKDTDNEQLAPKHKKMMNVRAKSLCNIPHRFAIAMCDDGWILRNTIIWHKPNCMPSSIKDRYTVDFENIFFFSKQERYYHQPQFSSAQGKKSGNSTKQKWQDESGFQIRKGFVKASDVIWDKRLKRAVWKIPSKPFPEAHFATYPEALCETPIKAGCPEAICKKCGKPRELIIESKGGTIGKSWHDHSNDLVDGMTRIDYGSLASAGDKPYQRVKKGYTDCGCNAGFEPGIVLDPFMGAGTTALVALKLHKSFLGVELNPKYIDIANARIKPWLSQTTLKTIN